MTPIKPHGVRAFYSKTSIFITGGTGFLGKVLIYKLLVSFPDINTIYILVRAKRGVQAQERLDKLLHGNDVFKAIPSSMLVKVRAIEGDISKTRLGMSNSDWQLLARSVTIVFHSAANIRFNDGLKTTLTTNVIGTRSVMVLAREMENLKAFVYISTAYSQCHLDTIEEKIYTDQALSPMVLELLMGLSAKGVDVLASNTIYPRPNNYVFSKAMAEQLLHEEAEDLPVVIVRPTMVVAAAEEPLPGWVDGMNGPTDIMASIAKGVLRSVYLKGDLIVDFVPVDFVINTAIVCASKARRVSSKLQTGSTVYHCTSGSCNPIRYHQFLEWCAQYVRKYPLENPFWYPVDPSVSSKRVARVQRLFQNWIPAYVVDAWLYLAGKRTFLVRMIGRMCGGIDVYEYFATRQWVWRDDNTRALFDSLSPEDRVMFDYNISKLDWKVFVENWVKGTRRFIFKQDAMSLESSRRNLRKMYALYVCSWALLCFLIAMLFFHLFS